MRLALEVMDMVFGQFVLEASRAVPGGVLAPVVGEHFLGHTVLPNGSAVDFQHMLGGLAAKQIQPDQIARVIVNEADQIGILAAQPKRADVGLPHLVRRGTLEKARFGWIALRLGPPRLQQPLLMERAPDGLATDRQQQHPPQPLADLLDAKAWLLAFECRDLRVDGRGQLGAGGLLVDARMLQTCFAVPAVTAQPLVQCVDTQAQFAGNQLPRVAFFQMQLHGFQSQLERVSRPAPRKPPRGLGFLFLLF